MAIGQSKAIKAKSFRTRSAACTAWLSGVMTALYVKSIACLVRCTAAFAKKWPLDHAQLSCVPVLGLICDPYTTRRCVWTDAPREGSFESTFYDSTVQQVPSKRGTGTPVGMQILRPISLVVQYALQPIEILSLRQVSLQPEGLPELTPAKHSMTHMLCCRCLNLAGLLCTTRLLSWRAHAEYSVRYVVASHRLCKPVMTVLISLFANCTCIVQLPKRLARRLMDLQFLPYIVVTNPHIKKVYDSYHHAFDTLHQMPPVQTIEQNADFTVLLKRLVDEHG